MTCPRQEREELEKILVGDFGVRAADSHGRRRAEEEDPVRTCFQRDADRITHSKAFRRLKHKTQVFSSRRATITAPGSRTRWR